MLPIGHYYHIIYIYRIHMTGTGAEIPSQQNDQTQWGVDMVFPPWQIHWGSMERSTIFFMGKSTISTGPFSMAKC